MTTTSKALGLGQTVALSTLVSAADKDGDALVYFFTDPAGGGRINLNGAVNQLSATQQAAGNYQVSAADFAKLTYTGNGAEQLSVWAYDGAQWSATGTLSITNSAPTVTATSKGVGFGQTVALSTLVSAADKDGDALVYFFTDPAGAGRINLNGAVNQLSATQQAAGNYQVSAADFAKLTYTGNGGEQLSVWAYDGAQWSATGTLSITNSAPTVAAASRGVGLGQTVALSTLVSAADPDGDALVYFFTDPAGGGRINLNGAVNQLSATQQAAGNYQVSAADFAKLTYTGNGIEQLTVWSYDGAHWSAPATLSMTNSAPTVTTTSTTLGVEKVVALSTLISAVDPDGDTVTRYTITDPAGGGRISLGGAINLASAAEQAAGSYTVSAADLSKVIFIGGGNEQLSVRAYDGVQWGGAAALTVTDSALVVTAKPPLRLKTGETVPLSDLFSVTDPSNSITMYWFQDLNPLNGGTVNLNGATNLLSSFEESRGYYQVSAKDLSKVTFTGDGTAYLMARSYNGVSWGEKALLSVYNAAPVVKTYPRSLKLGETVSLSELFSVTDYEGDQITKYSIWDKAGGGTVNLNGATNLLGSINTEIGRYEILASDFAKLTYTGGGTEDVEFSAFDGGAGYVVPLRITNAAPVVEALPKTLNLGQTVNVSTLFNVTDPDGDTITRYAIKDQAGGGTIELNGATNLANATDQAAGVYEFSAADLAKVTYTSNGREELSVRACDGGQWSGSASVLMNNGAPVLTAVGQSLKAGQTVDMSTLFKVADAGDLPVTLYSIHDPNGGGHVNLNGATNLASGDDQTAQIYWVSQADLGKVTYTGGTTEDLAVSAFDGVNWGNAVAVTLTNSAPTVSVIEEAYSLTSPFYVYNSEPFKIADLLEVSDREGDQITQYQINAPSVCGKMELNGATNLADAADQANDKYLVSAADLAKLEFTFVPNLSVIKTPLRDGIFMEISAYDGVQWSKPGFIGVMIDL